VSISPQAWLEYAREACQQKEVREDADFRVLPILLGGARTVTPSRLKMREFVPASAQVECFSAKGTMPVW